MAADVHDGLIYGMDARSQGTWMGVNAAAGHFAALTNIGPGVPGMTSRGPLCISFIQNPTTDNLKARFLSLIWIVVFSWVLLALVIAAARSISCGATSLPRIPVSISSTIEGLTTLLVSIFAARESIHDLNMRQMQVLLPRSRMSPTACSAWAMTCLATNL